MTGEATVLFLYSQDEGEWHFERELEPDESEYTVIHELQQWASQPQWWFGSVSKAKAEFPEEMEAAGYE